MKRAGLFPLLFFKHIAAVAAMTVYLTGCGMEIVDVTAPQSVTGGQPFEIEVTHQFYNSGGIAEEEETRLVFVFVVPEAWNPQTGGSYDAEYDGVPISLGVEALATIQSDWNEALLDPEAVPELFGPEGSPCVPVEAPSDAEDCALVTALDAIGYVPFFYGGEYPPPDETTYQLLYVRTDVLPSQPIAADDTGVLTMPFVAGALQPADEIPFIVAQAIQTNLAGAELIRERLPADQQERWPVGAGAADAHEGDDTLSLVWWVWSAESPPGEIDGVQVPLASVGEASVTQFAEILPVPIGGPALLALITLGLMGLGISAGRRKRRKI